VTAEADQPLDSLKGLVTRMQAAQPTTPSPAQPPMQTPTPMPAAIAPQPQQAAAIATIAAPLPPPPLVNAPPPTTAVKQLAAAPVPPASPQPASTPAPQPGPQAAPAQAAQSAAPLAAPPAVQPTPPTWSQALAKSAAANPAQTPPADQPRPFPSPFESNSLGAAPLPGEPWTDPDGVNWSDAVAGTPTIPHDRRRGWLGDWRPDPNPAGESRSGAPVPGGRILDRLRGGERRLAHLPAGAAGTSAPYEAALPDIGQWPRPIRLEQQLEHLASTAAGAGQAGEPIGQWTDQTRATINGVLETRGPRDAAADPSLIVLGETVLAGMTLADTTTDAALASHTRRTALAVARRVAVWRAATALFVEIKRQPEPIGDNDAAAAMTRQAAGRAAVEISRLLDGIERFELGTSPADATLVKSSLGSICGFYPSASRAVARAVEDHYLAPNVRIAVHQEFLEKLLPGATVETAPFQDTVAGREVRGTRTVERTTTLRLVPDEDEICFNLEVHGDIASRAVTDAGPVSVTARSASAFTVRKPIKISTHGLLFGNAAGVASNRSHLDAIQTSFDALPVMGSLVRTMAKSQHAETMPEVNREVIDKIISRACREVDSQSEPQFAEIANRVRERVWMPLVRLGLDPRAVALQTTASMATMRLRLAGDTQLAAHTPRPRAPTDAMLSLQVHESSVNNALDRLGIAGRKLGLEELIRTVSVQAGVEPHIPDDLPEGVSVAFAQSQPIRVECRDGLVQVHVALDSIESGRRDWYNLAAHVTYRPTCVGSQVFLEREGPIRLTGQGHEGRMELALRTIFGKIFPKERPIALLPDRIANNPQLSGVQATQAVSSDGWLALTLAPRAAAPATAAPARPTRAPEARASDPRRKPLFR
jgi:hypothetical protein